MGRQAETIIVELRAAEGGAHARELLREQLGIYLKFARRREL
jgi:protein subunit release factor A